MANYEEVKVTLIDCQLKKLKSRLKKLIINFQGEELAHKLFLKTRKKNKIRNNFANNMSAQLCKIIQLVLFLGALFNNLVGTLMKFGIPLAKMFLSPLATVALASAIDGAI